MYVRLQWRGRDLLRHVVYFEDIDIFSCGKRIRKNTIVPQLNKCLKFEAVRGD